MTIFFTASVTLSAWHLLETNLAVKHGSGYQNGTDPASVAAVLQT